MSNNNYVRVTATLTGEGRNQGVGYNVRSIDEVAEIFDSLRHADLTNVKAVRIVPKAVSFTTPRNVAGGLDGAKASRYW